MFDGETFELEEEHFLKRKPFFSEEYLLLCLGKMHVGKRGVEIGEMKLGQDVGGEGIGNCLETLKDGRELPAEEFRCEAGGFGVDGDEAAGVCGSAFGALESWTLHDESFFVLAYFAGEPDSLTYFDHAFDKALIEPDDTEASGRIFDTGSGDEHFLLPRALTFDFGYYALDRSLGIALERVNQDEGGIVFVAVGEMIKEVTHGFNSQSFEAVPMRFFDIGEGIESGGEISHKGDIHPSVYHHANTLV